jgi:hypothetical protein
LGSTAYLPWRLCADAANSLRPLRGECRRVSRRGLDAKENDANDSERPMRPTRGVLLLPPALAAAPPRIARWGVPIALEKEAGAFVAPDIVARLARHEAALGLVVQHRDELGAIVGLAA